MTVAPRRFGAADLITGELEPGLDAPDHRADKQLHAGNDPGPPTSAHEPGRVLRDLTGQVGAWRRTTPAHARPPPRADTDRRRTGR